MRADPKMDNQIARTSEKPVYSIVIPTFNRPDLLTEAVVSALKAAPPRSEIIIVNDGARIDLAITSQNLRIVPNNGVAGASGARNSAVDEAQGEWLFFMDDDDVTIDGYWKFVSDTILQTLNPLEFAYGSCRVESFKERPPPVATFDPVGLQVIHRPAVNSLTGLGKGFWISKHAYKSIGGLDVDLKVNEDTDLCVALLANGAVHYYCDSVGMLIYNGQCSGNQVSVTKSQAADIRFSGFKRIIEKHRTFLADNPTLNVWLHQRAFQYAARIGAQPSFDLAAAGLTFSKRAGLLAHYALHWIVSTVRRGKR